MRNSELSPSIRSLMSKVIVLYFFFFLFQGFLVESKLTKLLAPLERDEQSLMKLDAIFAVSFA